MLKTATPTVPLQFESEPAGAEVKTSGGQTCKTPCALAVPAADFMATFALTGFEPQTVAVKMMPPDDVRGDTEVAIGAALPRFDPSPVYAELVKAAPRRPAKKPRVARPAAEPQPRAAAPTTQPASPPPPSSSPWPPAANPIR
jgi:hypothetical protein